MFSCSTRCDNPGLRHSIPRPTANTDAPWSADAALGADICGEVAWQMPGSHAPESGSRLEMRPLLRSPSQYFSAVSWEQAITQASPLMCASCTGQHASVGR